MAQNCRHQNWLEDETCPASGFGPRRSWTCAELISVVFSFLVALVLSLKWQSQEWIAPGRRWRVWACEWFWGQWSWDVKQHLAPNRANMQVTSMPFNEVLSALTMPYLRIPLLLHFLAADRLHALKQMSLRWIDSTCCKGNNLTYAHDTCLGSCMQHTHINNIEPHEAVPEVSKGKVHITQDKHVPIEIDCDFLNTFHSISHATLSWCWLERRSTKNHSVLLRTTQYYSSTILYYSCTTLYYRVLLQYYSVLQSTTPVLLCTTQYYSSTTLY